MKRWLFLLPAVLCLLAAQDSPPVAITSPAPGAVLRGPVPVIGTTHVPGFLSAQVDFAYAADPAGTWFPLQSLFQPVLAAPLFTWDTTAITDGDYILRLRVLLEDGTFQEVTVPVSLQNDFVPSETPAPTPTPEEVTVLVPTPFLLAASPTSTDIPRPTPTPLPANPASLKAEDIVQSLGRGALVILGVFVLAGLILRVRRF